MIALAVKQYGEGAASLLRKWREILHSDKSLSDAKKLEAVNRFFNSVPYVSDLEHWGKADYWATPLELLASNGGDSLWLAKEMSGRSQPAAGADRINRWQDMQGRMRKEAENGR